MARLTNTTTGIVVNVSDEHAARLVTSGWAPEGSSRTSANKRTAKKTAAKKTAAKGKSDG